MTFCWTLYFLSLSARVDEIFQGGENEPFSFFSGLFLIHFLSSELLRPSLPLKWTEVFQSTILLPLPHFFIPLPIIQRFLPFLSLRTWKCAYKLDDARKHSISATPDVDFWILLFTLKSRRHSVKRTKEQQHLKTLLSQHCETTEASGSCWFLTSLMCGKSSDDVVRYTPAPGAFSLGCCSFKRWKREDFEFQLCEKSYWCGLLDNSIKHPAQTSSVGWINGSSVLALYSSLLYLREKKRDVGKSPKINKWMCQW